MPRRTLPPRQSLWNLVDFKTLPFASLIAAIMIIGAAFFGAS